VAAGGKLNGADLRLSLCSASSVSPTTGQTAQHGSILYILSQPATAHDFDYFAAQICDKYRVVCPDVGGKKNHLPDQPWQ